MAERDFANDYDEWLRQQGGDPGYGNTIPTQDDSGGSWIAPPSVADNFPIPTTTTPPTTNTTGGKTPAEIEAEGREYDRQHGLIGGYMMNGQWVNGSPYAGGGGGGSEGGGGSRFGSGSPYQFAPLAWPDWNPPEFKAPPAFSYADFKPPTLEEAMNEPGYKFAADEGAKRIQNNAAAKGNVVSGGAIKDLVKWANDYATQNYNGVYGRGLQTYSTNRNNAADNYMTNYNVSRDVFDRGYNSYAAGNQSQRQKAQLDFQRDWDVYQSDLDTKKFLTTAGNQ
jgi:hypothetical protein